MAGISNCNYTDCPKHDTCFRYTLDKNKVWCYMEFKNICTKNNNYQWYWKDNKKIKEQEKMKKEEIKKQNNNEKINNNKTIKNKNVGNNDIKKENKDNGENKVQSEEKKTN